MQVQRPGWLLKTDKLGKKTINQRRREEAQAKSGGAANSHNLGRRMCCQYNNLTSYSDKKKAIVWK